MKAYTNLEQSKKLAEILPLESADMTWCNNSIRGVNYTDEYSVNLCTIKELQECFDNAALNGWDKYWKLIPCWSLVALLSVIGDKFKYDFTDNGKSFVLTVGDFEILNKSLIDACYEMIIKLHELNLL